MMMRFFLDAIGVVPNKYEIRNIVTDSVNKLKNKYPNLTPRALEHQIWLYQRAK
jgi:hypothetical protein